MLNNKNTIITDLRRLGLSTDEAKVYLELLDKPLTHLELARKTNINRTKIYRIADMLSEKSLIAEKQRDDGKFLTATDPSNLQISLAAAQEKVTLQQQLLKSTMPALSEIFTNGATNSKGGFTIDTYEGTAGLKQMLWNELKTQGEICAYAHDTLDQVAGNRWAEKYRTEITSRRIPHRVLENADARHVLEHTKVEDYKTIYTARHLDRSVLDLHQELTIHDDTVSIYNWNSDGKGEKVGLEIHNQQFADFQKAIFETYWKLAA